MVSILKENQIFTENVTIYYIYLKLEHLQFWNHSLATLKWHCNVANVFLIRQTVMSQLVYRMTIGEMQVNTDLCQVIHVNQSAAQCSRLHENVDQTLYHVHHNLVLFWWQQYKESLKFISVQGILRDMIDGSGVHQPFASLC